MSSRSSSPPGAGAPRKALLACSVALSVLGLWALADDQGEPLSLQRLARGRVWRTIAHLRAGPAGVLNVLFVLRGRATLRLLGADDTSAPSSVGRLRSRL